MTYFIKLRNNVALDEDVHLAVMELEAFFQNVLQVFHARDLQGFTDEPDMLMKNTRAVPPYGFMATGLKKNIKEVIMRISFVQEVWCDEDDGVPDSKWCRKVVIGGSEFILYVPFLCAAEMLTYFDYDDLLDDPLGALSSALSTGSAGNAKIASAIKRKNTSVAYVHGIHQYKAKFFPRMIRSVMAHVLDDIPDTPEGRKVLYDPFMGSGTALVESSSFGMDSVGADIDPLAMEITSVKIALLNDPRPTILEGAAKNMLDEGTHSNGVAKKHRYEFPPWIRAKFDRWNTPQKMHELEDEISKWADTISRIKPSWARSVFRVCLSDALTKKFKMRFLGTGSGRFSLEISKTPLSTLVRGRINDAVRIARVCEVLREEYDTKASRTNVLKRDSLELDLGRNNVSVILTSPPYIPSSSGRENYLLGKSVSITALGLMTPTQISNSLTKSVGSMEGNGDAPSFMHLPDDVRDLYEWLRKDEMRSVKAAPIVNYYNGIRKSLTTSGETLCSNGLAIYVIGKESVFYNFKSRKVLRTIHCANIFEKIADSCGFSVRDRFDVKLDKKNRNARPRSRDSYYETVFVLQKRKA